MQFHSVTLKIAAFVFLAMPLASAGMSCTETGGENGCSFHCYSYPGNLYRSGYCDSSKRFCPLTVYTILISESADGNCICQT
jgi:hypothetical protein